MYSHSYWMANLCSTNGSPVLVRERSQIFLNSLKKHPVPPSTLLFLFLLYCRCWPAPDCRLPFGNNVVVVVDRISCRCWPAPDFPSSTLLLFAVDDFICYWCWPVQTSFRQFNCRCSVHICCCYWPVLDYTLPPSTLLMLLLSLLTCAWLHLTSANLVNVIVVAVDLCLTISYLRQPC